MATTASITGTRRAAHRRRHPSCYHPVMTVRRIHRQLLAGTLTSVVAVVTALVLTPAAHALTVSPLPGTPDASPHTQISFLGVDARAISGLAVVGSRSGRHRGGLEAYASGAG